MDHQKLSTVGERGQATKAAKGVAVRHWKNNTTTIRISFGYKGIECRETLALAATKANLLYAERLRAEILNAIGRGTFNYGEYFPESKRARIFGHVNANPLIRDLLLDFLKRAERSLERSTVSGYHRVTHGYLLKAFGKIPIRQLTPAHVRKWVTHINVKAKTIRNILIPLRAVVAEAINDDIIEKNPLDRVILDKLLEKQQLKSNYLAKPFSLDEINAILAQAVEPQLRHLIQFIFFTGLRNSEWMALKWSDIDWEQGTVRICRAFVEQHEKTTKTPSGIRSLLLLPPALEALEAQKAYTYAQHLHVFQNPHTQKPWQSNSEFRYRWEPLLEKAGVPYRNPYQMRHTFASMLLSAGENMLWAAKQLGHRDTEMIMKTYAKWLPDNQVQTGYQPSDAWQQILQSKQLHAPNTVLP